MDEKHWWFATKLQESFQIGGYDSPTLLEDFLSDANTTHLIDSLLSSGGLRKLFFFCKGASGERLSSRELYVSESPKKGAFRDGYTCLYFMRLDNSRDVDVTRIEKEIFCGEVKQSLWAHMELLLTEVYSPLLKAQTAWGKSGTRDREQFLSSLDKIGEALATDFTSSSRAGQHSAVILKQPRRTLVQELKQLQQQQLQLRMSMDSSVLLEVEGLVGEWMMTIEGVMIEGAEDR